MEFQNQRSSNCRGRRGTRGRNTLVPSVRRVTACRTAGTAPNGSHSQTDPVGISSQLSQVPQGVMPPEGPRIAFEDDVLVTETGHDWLSENIPIEIDDVEALSSEKSLFDPFTKDR